MFEYYNPNPKGKLTGDCVIRAISKATGQSWYDTYIDLCIKGYQMGDWGHSNAVWNAYLMSKGFKRGIIPNTCPDCYKIADFANEHNDGIYILGTGTHIVCVQNGTIFDSWNSSSEIPIYFYFKE